MNQLDGFMFMKIPYGRRFYAYNTESDFIVFWLGNDEKENVMQSRIKDYGAYNHVEAKSFTRQEALRYYQKAVKANENALRAEIEATADLEPYYPEWSHPLEKWRYQPRF